jgi:hypothetical protein
MALTNWLIPHAIGFQQSRSVFRQLITGKEGNMVICHMGHPVKEQIGPLLGAFTHHKSQDQAPNGSKGQPHPGVAIAFTINFGPVQVAFFGMHKTP